MADTELPIEPQRSRSLFLALDPFFEVATTIDGKQYIFNVRWNDRDGAWYFDLLDETGDPIMSGIKMVLGVLLGRRCVDPRKPNGALFMSDLSNANRDATLTDLGTRVKMYFRPAADFEVS